MNVHRQRYEVLRFAIDARLRSLVKGSTPKEVKEACRYVLSAGGKRVRPALLLLSCEAVGGSARKALDASTAIELMHNFTLVHDDIMDNAASRRGAPTVHMKWDANTALLVGDVVLGLAYRQALKTPGRNLKRIMEIFTDGLIDVCEGQALDLEFEHRSNITVNDYFRMIEKKTGRLIATSAELGALVGGGTQKQVDSLRTFGHYLGRAFQLQDDLLDVVADEKDFGKVIGGDIIEGKKTFLLLKALEQARGRDRMLLMRVMNRKSSPPLKTRAERLNEVRTVTAIYRTTGALDAARRRIRQDTQRAEAALAALPRRRARESLLWFSQMLLKRNS